VTAQRAPHTVVAFGDSITHGAAFPEEERWTAVVETRLRREGHPCRVCNAGIGGNTTAQGLARMEQDVLAHAPMLVLVEFGFNDCHLANGTAPRTPLAEFRHNQRRIGRAIAERTGATVVYIANHPTLLFDTKADGRTYEASNEVYNRTTRVIAAELDWPLLDMHRLFGRRGSPLVRLLTEDGLHLSAEGNREYAEIVGDFLLEWFRVNR
jgi:lysophospholipase L1-like esterase